ncbi:MAG: MGMT family protein [Candidatus Micrarchaeota archaeon]|nr:MGMT family protein [Candidatus Micrarchaeota archaeon]
MSKRSAILKKLDSYGLTKFQKKVLRATLNIPRGEVRTYKQIAVAIGHPRSYRAVGSTLRDNPLAPDIPCHRVIRSDGDIGEYSSSGGRRKKAQLLSLEKAVLPKQNGISVI